MDLIIQIVLQVPKSNNKERILNACYRLVEGLKTSLVDSLADPGTDVTTNLNNINEETNENAASSENRSYEGYAF